MSDNEATKALRELEPSLVELFGAHGELIADALEMHQEAKSAGLGDTFARIFEQVRRRRFDLAEALLEQLIASGHRANWLNFLRGLVRASFVNDPGPPFVGD